MWYCLLFIIRYCLDIFCVWEFIIKYVTVLQFVAFCVVLVISYATAIPITPEQARRNLPALKHEEIRDNYGQYAFRFVTAEGTVVSERGYLVPNSDGNGYVLAMEGQTTYIGEDGKPITTIYKAGPNGSEVHGTHLPVQPQPDAVFAQWFLNVEL